MKEKKTLWEVWTQDLPVSYNKAEALERVQKHWKLSPNATYNRMKQGKFETVSDVVFFFEELAIAFDYKRGFFFDGCRYEYMLGEKEKMTAAVYGLTQ